MIDFLSLITSSRERVESVQYLLHQRQINEILSQNLRLEQDKHLQLEKEHQDEIQRLKRDFALELYRKQDAEKKARLFEEKFRHEQTLNQKIQYDFTQTKHELKTLQVKYDALQLELIEMHRKSEIKPIPVVEMFVDRTSTSTVIYDEPCSFRTKRRTNEEVRTEYLLFALTYSGVRMKRKKRQKSKSECLEVNQRRVLIQHWQFQSHPRNLRVVHGLFERSAMNQQRLMLL